MPRKFILLLLLILPQVVAGQSVTGPQHSGPPLNVNDGTTSCYPYSLVVSAGTLSCSNSIATITTGGGGGGSGNVGIGTTTHFAGYVGVGTLGPFQTVEVNGNVGMGTLSPTSQLEIVSGTGDRMLDVRVGGYHALRVDGAGTVGVGTTTPDSSITLDVAGPTTIHGGDFNFNQTGPFNTWYITDVYGGSGIIFEITGSNVGSAVLVGNCAGSSPFRTNLDVCRAYGSISNSVTNFNSRTTALTALNNFSNERYNSFFAPTLVGIGTTVTNASTVYIDGPPTGNATINNPAALRVDSGNIINVAGNVGVGTFLPNNRLDVVGSDSGTTLTSSSAAMASVINTNTTNNNFGDYSLCTNDASGVRTCGAKISGVFTSHTGSAVSTDLAFLTMNAGTAAEKLRITASGNIGIGTITPQSSFIVSNGNVGIGTWVAISLLDVKGATRTTTLSATSGSSTAITSSGGISALTGNFLSGAGIDLSLSASNSLTKNIFIQSSSGNVGIGTTTPQGGFVVTNGNVGIGTWAPTAKLFVAGGNVGIGTNNTLHSLLEISGDGNTELLRANDSGQNDATPLVIASDGNLGVGVTAPGRKLEISSAGSTGFRISSTAAATSQFFELNQNGVVKGTWGYHASSDMVQIAYGANFSTTFMGLNSSGNLGVGTINPGVTLDVVGSIRTRGVNKLIFGDDNTADIEASATITPDIKFMTNSVESMRITNGGNVGIGTTTPQGKFIVLGGNVGIGTWSPTSALTISDAPFQTPVVAGSKHAITIFGNGQALFQGRDTVNSIEFAMGSSSINSSGFSGSMTNHPFELRTNNITKLAITTGGNVGINMLLASPSSKLAVAGNIGIGTNASSSYVVTTAGPSGGAIIEGNLGIGTVTPGTKLDVQGSIRGSDVSAQADGTILCVKSGRIGYCSGVIAGVACTCN